MKVTKLLGHGAFGQVYKCISPDNLEGFEGGIVIKRLSAPDLSDYMFNVKEMDINRKFNHEHILPLRCLNDETGAVKTIWPRDINESPEEKKNKGKEEQEVEQEIRKKRRDDEIAFIYDEASCGDLCTLVDETSVSELRAKSIIMQVLLAVEYMHLSGYIHRDIKPSNILHFGQDRVKVCDFGMAKKYLYYDFHSPGANTDYFRAPEILLSRRYDYGADIWATGCTLHFLLSRSFIANFNHESDEKMQFTRILQAMPYEQDLSCFGNHSMLKGMRKYKCCTLEQYVKDYAKKLTSIDAYGKFLFDMLVMNPKERLTATELLESDYLKSGVKIIALTRSMNNFPIDEPDIDLYFSSARDCIKDAAMQIFVEYRNTVEWYADKLLFTAIDLYDRLISLADEQFVNCQEKDCLMHFKSCFYLSAKYYLANVDCDLRYCVMPFPELVSSDPNKARLIEIFILETLNNAVYNTSCYDQVLQYRLPTIEESMGLLLFVLEGKHHGGTSKQAYILWEQCKQKYINQAIAHKDYSIVKSATQQS